MSIEDELELALRAEAARIDPPVTGLVDGGVARGRAMQRRHRARLAAGGAALALVAGAGTVLGVPLLNGDDGGSPPVAADGSGGSNADDAAAPPDAPSAEIDPDAVVEALVALLPSGKTSDIGSSVDGPTAVFDLVWDDGAGASWITGSLTVRADDNAPLCPVYVNGGTCESRTLDDGTVLLLMNGPYYPQPDREPDRLQSTAMAVVPGGLTVTVAAMNTPTEKDSEPTRAEPPFSLDQLEAVVTDGVWAELTAGVEAPSGPVEPGPEDITAGSEALAEDLGPGWTAAPYDTATPGPEVTAGLPDGVEAGAATIMEFGADLSIAQHCEPLEEKGRISQPCTTTTTPDGETVQVQWATTTLEGAYAAGGYTAEVWAIAGTDERWFRVSALVSDTADATTPERRDAMTAWLEDKVDDLARAATAAGAAEPG